MTYGTEFYIDDTLYNFGITINGKSISMYDDIFAKAFGDNNVCVLQIPEMPLRKWFNAYWPNEDSFEDWITREQTADEMDGFFDEFKDLYDLNPKRIGFQKYIDALRESEV